MSSHIRTPVPQMIGPMLTLCALSLGGCAREDGELDSAEPGWSEPEATLAFRRMEYSDEGLRAWFDGDAQGGEFELLSGDGALLAKQSGLSEDSVLFDVKDPGSLIDPINLVISSSRPGQRIEQRFNVLWDCEPSKQEGYACVVHFEADDARGDAIVVRDVGGVQAARSVGELLSGGGKNGETLGDFLKVIGRLEQAEPVGGCRCTWIRSTHYDPSTVSVASDRDGSAHSSGIRGVGPGATTLSSVQAAAGEASHLTELILDGSVDASLSLHCVGELAWERAPVSFSVGKASAVSVQIRDIPFGVEPCASCEANIDVLTGISAGVRARVAAGHPSVLSCSGVRSEVAGGPTLEYFPDVTSHSPAWEQQTLWSTESDLATLELSQSAFALTQAAGRDGDRAYVQARAGATFAVYGESNCAAPTSFYSARSIPGRPAAMEDFFTARGYSPAKGSAGSPFVSAAGSGGAGQAPAPDRTLEAFKP